MNQKRIRLAGITAIVLGLAAPLALHAQHHHGAHQAQLGKVHFEVSCNAEAQSQFDLAMAYYHSFAWQSVDKPLDAALRADPSCGMVHWLRTLAMLDNPFGWPIQLSEKRLDGALASLEEARKTGVKTQRERDFVEALAVFLKDHKTVGHRSRAQAFEQALAQVAQRYPKDTEAAVLHALVLSANFDPADKTFSNQLRAAQILEPIAKEQPDHPGVAHYLIHTYDYPPIAQHGLEAARRYAKLAASAPHALHMPSHIFTRVGAWRDSIESNRASAATAPDHTFDKLHAYDYMAYAHAQLAQDQAMRQVLEQARKATPVDHFAFAYASAAIPARYALERGDWKAAAALELHPSAESYPWKKYPQSEAVHAFGRGIGAAMNGDVGAAHAQAKRLVELRDAMAALKNPYWVEQIDIQADVVRGLAILAEGNRDSAIAILTKPADREDATQKHVVTPGPLVPAREVLGQALLGTGRPAEALRAFESVLEREPNRYRAMAGAAQAAERVGHARKAALHRALLLKMTEQADTPRLEIADAKRNLRR